MPHLPFRSISRFLIGRIVMLACLSFFVMSSIHALLAYRAGKAEFETTIREILVFSVPQISVSLWDIEPEALRKQLQLISERPEIAAVRLTTLTGQVFEAGNIAPSQGETKISIDIPYPRGIGQLGSLQIIGKDIYLHTEIVKHIAEILLGYFLFVTLICVAIVALLRRKLQVPLERLARYAQELVPGETIEPVLPDRRAAGYVDEVDVVAAGFEKLQNKVFTHVAELDQLVARRTSELALHNLILEQIGQGLPLSSVLEKLAGQVESIHPNVLCSILLLDKDGKHLRHGAAPSLPDFYNQAIDGAEIGDGIGSCGTAAYRGERVIVENILEHPYWVAFRELASKADVQSCWSQPVFGSAGEVVGTFALYHRQPAYPSDAEIAIIERYSTLASLAIERKRAEGQLKTFARAIDQSPVSIIITDPQGSIEYVNPKFEQVTGYSPSEAIGRTPGMLSSGATRTDEYKMLWQTIQSGKTWRGEFHNRRKDGSLFWEQASISPILDDVGRLIQFVAVKEDITERKLVEAELESYRQDLEKLVDDRTHELSVAKETAESANHAKSVFLANMSHELRTPMNAIMGMTDLVLRHSTDVQQRDRLGKVIQASRHLLGIINAILDISKIEAEQVSIEETDLTLGCILNNLNSIIGQQVDDKGLQLHIEIDPDLANRAFLGDPLRLGQVLLNLTSNAVKFATVGVIGVAVRVDDEDETGATIRIEVRDQGIGISADDQRRLFKPFHQADGSMTRKYGGTGLGLAISKRLTQMMGGSIGLESQLGSGSTFWFTVRLGKGTILNAPAPTLTTFSAEERLKTSFLSAHVLLVEDEPINQEVSRNLLEAAGLKVELAENGLQAVAMARHTDYDLILMDMQMPGLNGLDATRSIRALPGRRDTPIIAMTANAFTEDRKRCIEAGMNDHIGKPVDPEILFETLLNWLS
jgi:PAS domain S-box-containing protein